jgi:hypothetical protein
MPFAIVYGLSDTVEFLLEPVAYTSIRPTAGPRANGAGAIELTITDKVHRESARLPAFAVAGEVKLPTGRPQLIGTGQPDIAAYVSESQRFGPLDTHAHVSYTFVGQPARRPTGAHPRIRTGGR